MTKVVALLLGLSLIVQKVRAQVDEDSQLYRELAAMDSLVFDEGFNRCNLQVLNDVISPDLEFYHDQGGFQDKRAFMHAMRENICSSPERKPIRKLVEGSLAVFPLYDNGELYGAIQQGEHEFYIDEPGKELYITNIARFTSLWMQPDASWQLVRAYSFDHRNPPDSYGARFDANYPEPLFTQDNEILSLLEQHDIPSVGIGYLSHGELQQVRVFGRKGNGNPARFNTVYKVASLTKPVTALVTLTLVDRDLWDLDEPIQRYYVDEEVRGDPFVTTLTTRHILSHQSGFPNWRHLTESGTLAFDFEPGTRFQYSGEGFEYLRKALEAHFGKSLETLASELLFEPLSMDNTSFFWSDRINHDAYAGEHDENGNPITFERHSTVNAAANLLTTVEDYGSFMAHVLNGGGLSDELYREATTTHVTAKPGIGWGLGLQVLDSLANGEYALQHTGGDYGVKAIAIMLPKSGRGLLIVSNSENGMIVWRKLLGEYFGSVGEEIVRRNLD